MGGGNILNALGGAELPITVKTALVSVYYKDGLEDLAALFKEKGVRRCWSRSLRYSAGCEMPPG